MTEPYDVNAAPGDDPKAIIRDWRYPPRAGGCVLLVSADDIYLRRFVGGIAASALLNAMRIHINAIGPAPVTLTALDALAKRFPGAVSLSVEADHPSTETRRPYYAASRFFCAQSLINEFNFNVYTYDIHVLIMRKSLCQMSITASFCATPGTPFSKSTPALYSLAAAARRFWMR